MLGYLLTAVACIILVIISIKYKSKVSYSFAFLCACITLWALELFFLTYLSDLNTLSSAFHLLRVGMFFIAPALILFSLRITKTKNQWFNSLFYLSLTTSLVISIANNLFFPSTLIPSEQGFLPKTDSIIIIYQVSFALSVVASILIGGLAYRKTIFTEKQRIAWIIVAYSLAGLSGLLAFNFSVVFGPIGVITSLSILAYAVFRYRLISARMAVSQLMAKSIAALSLVMVYILINEFMAQNLITQEPRAIYINALYMLCFFGLYNKLESNLRTYSDPLLVGYYYNLQDEKTAIVNRLSHCLDNRELKTTLDDIFYRLIKVKNYRIYLRHKQRNVFNRFDIENNLIDKEVPEQAFSQSREVTFYEEVGAEEKKAFIGLQQSAFVPILAQDKVIGIITLGQPLKKEQFALRDIQLLSWLGNRLGDVIQIVLKYNQCMDELSEARKTLSMISLFNAYNHDVKAPLNNISALVRAGDLLPTEEKEQLILEQTHLGLNRVNTMCNILSGSNNQSKQTVDLNQSIRNVHRLFEMNIKKTELRLESIPKLLARQDMVEILLSNLYKNAIEACSGKPVLLTIRTSYDKVKNTIVFMFADNGKGMHAHMVDTLFTQPITTKKDQGGSGVGMSVIKNIINELDGHMHIHSAVDRGTTFTFSIPPLMHMVEDSATVVSDVGETGLSKY